VRGRSGNNKYFTVHSSIGCIFYWYIGLAISAVIEINKKMDLILYELRRARKDKE
jgi:hypothetical protein